MPDTTANMANASPLNRYGEMCAEVYVLDKPPGALGDIDYYRQALGGLEGPFLEAACGSGRLMIPMLEAGFDYHGFDHSEHMLAQCRKAADERGLPLKIQRSSVSDQPPLPQSAALGHARAAQPGWARTGLRARLAILRKARRHIASTAVQIARSVPGDQPGALHRTVADTLVSEVLPLAEACRFLEIEARWILAPQRLTTHTRPFWLRSHSRPTFLTIATSQVYIIESPRNWAKCLNPFKSASCTRSSASSRLFVTR